MGAYSSEQELAHLPVKGENRAVWVFYPYHNDEGSCSFGKDSEVAPFLLGVAADVRRRI